jgi:hypothetical protein
MNFLLDSLFRRTIPCSGETNSLFRFEQGIARNTVKLLCKLTFGMTNGCQIRWSSLLNSLFSVRHRALPDLHGMKAVAEHRQTVFDNLLSF